MSGSDTTVVPADPLLSELADAILDGGASAGLQRVAEGLGVNPATIKAAVRSKALPVVRVSPRRIVVTRAGLIAYLLRLNDTEVGGAE